jgi:hypothetical protein
MRFDLLGMDAEFQTEGIAVAPRRIATKGHDFKNEGMVAINFDNRISTLWQ